jgi:hypothetical protein
MYTEWGGLGTYDDAAEDAAKAVPLAAFKKFETEVGRVMRG